MKLISFVAISFLAITVSAKPPLRNSLYQSIRSSQSSRQFDQAEVEAEIERLREAHEKEEKIFAPIENDAKINRQNAIALIDKVSSISAELKLTAADSDARSELERKHYYAKTQFDILNSKYDNQFSSYSKAKQKRDDAKAAVDLLVENQDLIKKHNAKDGGQMGLSLGFFYNIDILKEQKDDIIKDLAILLAEWKKINVYKNGLQVDKNGLKSGLRARRIELRDKILPRESQRKIAMNILQNYKQRQSMGAQVRKFLYSYMPNTQI
ncbi:hypothetical protein BASA50_003974 [Batrachochytrium salamandrivorans]|uniref:Uncharacterized protein n=1 Tax=Batrachochytrium salamandrivorans TaxID=1357716 RepID=A0ABQ8FGX0_9FUNG|nr:hypothetical protein BASA62_005932 [Batrachochytrium salamandrivorans]KAH6571434.1 hypothetical protein BASA60_007146 [Batrachochytrium salamandrivorans]KAH6598093.1 hypothetical protein BASA50_003974 [Batrachochytrium salamandrivorans]KAH9249001.1 hypothetical protein BASA81_013297 [Batrachochytrium salamandrivorans]KAH9272473.1 hypothetical protein BASA83_005280 [Batrachochytrium salamandrivorans]